MPDTPHSQADPAAICAILDSAIDILWLPLLICAVLAVIWAAWTVASLDRRHV